jgi:hypothetical protein
MAYDNNIKTLANMIITGKVLKEVDGFSLDNVDAALKKVVSARKIELLGVNETALKSGYDYAE